MSNPSRLRRHRPIALLLLALQLAGCYRWEPTTVSPREFVNETHPQEVRVSLSDSVPQLHIGGPFIDGDAIVGHAPGSTWDRREVALDRVTAIEARRVDALKTMGLITVIVGAVGFVWGLSELRSSDWGGGGGSWSGCWISC